jgi:hypothetical protein
MDCLKHRIRIQPLHHNKDTRASKIPQNHTSCPAFLPSVEQPSLVLALQHHVHSDYSPDATKYTIPYRENENLQPPAPMQMRHSTMSWAYEPTSHAQFAALLGLNGLENVIATVWASHPRHEVTASVHCRRVVVREQIVGWWKEKAALEGRKQNADSHWKRWIVVLRWMLETSLLAHERLHEGDLQ